jgi:predicted  nucleic acid-binding Zn-ribbon protein
MAKPQDNELYRRMRASGVRKKVARELTELPAHVKDGKQAPKAMRDAVDRLETTVTELREHIGRSERQTAARKAARTRRSKAKEPRASTRQGGRRRAQA